jgi:hypothetical protein
MCFSSRKSATRLSLRSFLPIHKRGDVAYNHFTSNPGAVSDDPPHSHMCGICEKRGGLVFSIMAAFRIELNLIEPSLEGTASTS